MLNFRQVEAFRAVMLTGSMTQAAKELHTTQPNISRVISQLESRLGLKLFLRDAGKLTPTAEGELFFRDVERTFVGLKSLEQSAMALGKRGSGHLRISAVPSLAMALVPKAMQAFSKLYPDVAITLEVTDSNSVCRTVAAGNVDIGIASDVLDSPGVAYQVAFEAAAVAILPSAHRLAGLERTLVPEDFAAEPFISLSPHDVIRQKIDAVFAHAGDTRVMLYESRFAAAICEMVSLGMGVSIANPFVAADFRHLPIEIRHFSPEILFPTYILHQHGSAQSLLSKEFGSIFIDIMN